MRDAPPLSIGVLALQGDFEEHMAVLRRIGVNAAEIRLPDHLRQIDALIIPGGESTTIGRLLRRWELRGAIKNKVRDGMPVWGTCAGAILLAERCDNQEVDNLRLMDIDVQRNAFGRQVDSFEADIDVPALGPEPFHAVFIRAPGIVATGPRAKVLARLKDGGVVAVLQSSLLATTFHPELTPDPRWHEYFVTLVSRSATPKRPAVTMD